MIRVLFLLLWYTLSVAQDSSYLLPDEKSIFDYSLEGAFKRAQSDIIILTPELSSPLLEKLLKRSLSKGTTLTLIVQNPANTSSSIVAYQNVALYLYSKRALHGSTIIIDNAWMCTLAAPLHDEQLISETQLITCTKDYETIVSAKKSFAKLLKRSKRYLE